jgi:SAM-dependent methyltransferase
MELLVGAGQSRIKKLAPPGRDAWDHLVTLDMFEAHNPDVVWDLENRPLPFDNDAFDEIHAYDVLEHLGRQGCWQSFFEEWSEWWRILKPGGVFCGVSPHWSSPWAWMDPGHRRVYGPEIITFLDQTQYAAQVGVSPMTDYRSVYKADFEPFHIKITAERQFEYGLKAHKPARTA